MNSKISLIAETAWHHEGDFKFFMKLVTELIENSKADIIKYHITIDLEEYLYKKSELYETLKKWMLSREQWVEILNSTIKGNKKLMLLFNDTSAIEFGMKFNPELVEIHSVCLNDIRLLNCLKSSISRNQKVVLGIGGTDLYEIENAINILQHENIILMFGFQNYPTQYNDINLNKMRKIMKMYPNFNYGYADHTAWNNVNNILITLLGAAAGMHYIEKHVTNHYGIKRCDWQAAVTIDMFNEIAEQLSLLKLINGTGAISLNEGERKYSVFGPMKKAALLVRDVKKGEKLSNDLIVFKRTDEITDCSQLDILNFFGNKFTTDLIKDSVIKKKHFLH
jgi:sialic acid synthase SpsE